MAATAGAIVYLVVRTPSLRHLAWRALKTGVTVTVPGYLVREATQAWAASGARP